MRVALADWDGDGKLDVIADRTWSGPSFCMSEGAWSVYAGVRASHAVEGPPAGGKHQPCIVDWDGDGRLDLIVADSRDQGDGKAPVIEINWHRNLSTAGAPRLDDPDRQTVTLMTFPFDELDGLSAGDWDGDGWPDLIVAYHSGKYDEKRRGFEVSGVRVYPRRGQGGSRL
jgi:FG-GAP-like repeat